MSASHFTPDEVVQRLDHLIASAPRDVPPDLPLSSVTGQPEWYAFEHRVWSEGEALRSVLAQHGRLKRHPDVLLAVVRVLECPGLRRGRQSFSFLFESRAAQPFAPRLVPLLSDPDIAGHVVAALVRMHAPGLQQQLAPYATSPVAWIRRLAQSYLTRPEA
jgi:hypothetical protein